MAIFSSDISVRTLRKRGVTWEDLCNARDPHSDRGGQIIHGVLTRLLLHTLKGATP